MEHVTQLPKTNPTEPTTWFRHSEAQDRRETLAASLKGWWKFRHPMRAWRLYKLRRSLREAKRRTANRRLFARRRNDPALASLNPEQRQAVLTQEDCTVVVAGAGTGKTHTMVEKARDTVRTGIARPEQIAFVTFTRKAAEEIRSRSADLEDMEIGTLHHLARRVIEMAEGKRPRLSRLAEDDQARIRQIEAWLLEAVNEDPSLLLDLQTRHQAFEICRQPGDYIAAEPRVPPDGIRVRSMGEARIATTLHLANIPYQYEAEFPVPEELQMKKGARYFPDFYLPDDPSVPPWIHGGIWLEHFAHDTEGSLPGQWDAEQAGATSQYQADRKWKERLHAALATRFAWTEFGDIQRCMRSGASFPDLLLRRIADLGGSSASAPSTWEVKREIERLRTAEGSAEHWRIAYEIDEWIRTMRQQVLLRDKVLEAAIDTGGTAEEAVALYRLATPVLDRYVSRLEDSGTIDHEGTILKAWRYLREGRVEPPWNVILVDEYQDVNPAQAAFIHALLRPLVPGRPSTGARLTAVGDDWQAIFGFQGGDVSLIRDFRDPAGEQKRRVARVTLRQTYRFGQALADTTRTFVTRGRGAIDREVIGAPGVKPDPAWPFSIVIASSNLTAMGEERLGKDRQGLTAGVLAVLARIGEQAPGAEVLILARRNAELTAGHDGNGRNAGIDRRAIGTAAGQSGIRLTYSTVHKAKGTEADYAIMLDGGPPRAGEAAGAKALERALRVFRGEGSAAEEERRIWYVALTRARYKVYVIVAAGAESHSPFVDELYEGRGRLYDVGEEDLADFLEPVYPMVPCPTCQPKGRNSAVLTVRSGRHGRFAGCTSYSAGPDHSCGYRERLCESCMEGLMARVGNDWAKCQVRSCGMEAPLCKCTVPRPMAQRRNRQTGQPFWGCQRYGSDEGCMSTKRWNGKRNNKLSV